MYGMRIIVRFELETCVQSHVCEKGLKLGTPRTMCTARDVFKDFATFLQVHGENAAKKQTNQMCKSNLRVPVCVAVSSSATNHYMYGHSDYVGSHLNHKGNGNPPISTY